MDRFVTPTNDPTPVPLCLGCAGPMATAEGGYVCPSCGITSGPVTR